MTGWKKGVFGALALLTGCVEALAASTGWTVPGKAAPEMEQPAVTIRLVSEKNALIPQAVNQMAVVIDQKNGWHTYWKMPGDAGFPTRFTFSLPISGIVGTMRKRKAATTFAHIKTGYLANVRAIGGYVQTESGKRYAVFAQIEGGKSVWQGIPFLDRVIEWVHDQE